MKRYVIALILAMLVFCASAQGAVVGWGENSHAALGAGYTGQPTLEVATLLTASPTEVVASASNGYALLPSGVVDSWGGDNYGQDCDGHKGIHAQKTRPGASLLKGIKQIAAADAHLVVLATDGTVYTCGSNGYGQGGDGFSAKGLKTGIEYGTPTPEHVEGLAHVARVFAGGADDVAQLEDGSWVGWGENKSGELNSSGKELTRPTALQLPCSVRTISLGGNATKGATFLVLCQDGTVMSDGNGRYGQLGNGSLEVTSTFQHVASLSNVTAVSATTEQEEALVEGHVWTWGENEVGDLGVGTGPEGCTEPSGDRPCSRTPVQVPGLSNVDGIAAGPGTGYAWSAGVGFSWGYNLHGELGNGVFGPAHGTPVPVEAKNVVSILPQERSSLAVIAGTAPAPLISIAPGKESLSVTWRDRPETIKWLVGVRPVTHPLSTWIYQRLDPVARSLTLHGLKSGQAYEVRVHDTLFGTRIVSGSPT